MQGRAILLVFLAWVAIADLYLLPPLRRISLLSDACYAMVINAAALVAILLAFTGRSIQTWKSDR
jgi:hypothetical protein